MINQDSIHKLKKHGVQNIPEDWNISKVKYIGFYINGYAFKPSDWGNMGKPILRIQNLTSSEGIPNRFDGDLPIKYIVKKGDYLISWSASLGIFIWKGEDSWLNQHIFKVIVNEKLVDKSFFVWLADWFIREMARDTHGSTMQHLTADAFGSFPVILPPIKSQKIIANFLDKEIAQIEKLIIAKSELCKKLIEKRMALIYQFVTNGVDPNVKMKNSGIDWIGRIPEHWLIERSRWVFRERNERSESGEEELLTVSHITGVTPRSEKDVNMFEAESNEGYKKCEKGDLVINTLWAWMGAMGIAPCNGIVSPAYHVYTPSERILPEYVDAIVRLPKFASEVTRYSKGVWSSRLRLYPEGFYEVYIPIPPINEQIQIVNGIKKEIEEIEKLKSVTENSISLLKERKASLVNEVITGKSAIV